MYPNSAPYPPAAPTGATPPRPLGKRRSVGGAVLLETLISGAGFMYAGRVGTGIFVFIFSIVLLIGLYLAVGALSQATGASTLTGNSTMIFITEPATLNAIIGIVAVLVVYSFARFVGAARAMFVRNSRVAGSSRPLAGLAALISVLSGTAVVIGGGLYTFGEQTCTTGFFFGTTCAAVTYPYQQMGTYLLVGGVIGLLIGLIG